MSRLRLSLLAGVSAFAGACLPSAAIAQAVSVDANSLMRRLDQIEQRLRLAEMQRPPSAQRGNAPVVAGSATGGTYALTDLDQRMGELEREMSQQTGGMERLQFALERIAKRVDDVAKDVDLRLNALEQQQANVATRSPAALGGGGLPRAEFLMSNAEVEPASAGSQPSPTVPKMAVAPGNVASSATVVTATTAVPASLSATDLYNRAYAFLTATDYVNARAWLEEFLKRHPNDRLADNAWYWLGEVQLVQNNPSAAVVSFRNGLKYFPNGAKVPSNLFKMGVALEQLKQPELARGAWQKLLKEHPKSPEATRAKEKMAGLKG